VVGDEPYVSLHFMGAENIQSEKVARASSLSHVLSMFYEFAFVAIRELYRVSMKRLH